MAYSNILIKKNSLMKQSLKVQSLSETHCYLLIITPCRVKNLKANYMLLIYNGTEYISSFQNGGVEEIEKKNRLKEN